MKVKVLVVDDNEVLVNLIMKYFNGSKEIEIIGRASNGIEAIEMIKTKEFDVLLLDLIMPLKDGIGVLDYMKESNIKKQVIMMSSYNQEDIIRKISEYGVRYFALKPFDMNDIRKKIIELNISKINNERLLELPDKTIQIQVTNLLHELGIPSHIKGYQYIRTAILMVYDNPGFIGGITKELYPDISIRFNTSIQRVERAIRHAIEVAWLRGDIDLMEKIFGHSVDIDRAKPTNSEFIVTIADKLRLDMLNVKA
ncbi:MAG: sporulation transcription factor Spo0A [bacterium]|nr:sporulation transcription factor Spo0A [bacterium]